MSWPSLGLRLLICFENGLFIFVFEIFVFVFVKLFQNPCFVPTVFKALTIFLTLFQNFTLTHFSMSHPDLVKLLSLTYYFINIYLNDLSLRCNNFLLVWKIFAFLVWLLLFEIHVFILSFLVQNRIFYLLNANTLFPITNLSWKYKKNWFFLYFILNSNMKLGKTNFELVIKIQ